MMGAGKPFIMSPKTYTSQSSFRYPISPILMRTVCPFFVISDLWSSISASVELAWYDWSGNQLNVASPNLANVSVGAINVTQIFQGRPRTLLDGFDPGNVVLVMSVTAQGRMPNSNQTRTFSHINFWSAAPLSEAQMTNPGLELSYSNLNFKLHCEGYNGPGGLGVVGCSSWRGGHLRHKRIPGLFRDKRKSSGSRSGRTRQADSG